MRLRLSILAAGVALLAIPAGTLAAGTTQDVDMKPTPTGASMMCRAALPNEKPTYVAGSMQMVCKTMSSMMKNGKMTVPSTTPAADKAWLDWLHEAMSVPRAGDA